MSEFKEILYDYSKLLGRMKECGFTQKTLAIAVNMGETSMNKSLNNKRRFQQDEMDAICDVLGILKNSIEDYFFCRKTLEI